jgi:hypothetical protein
MQQVQVFITANALYMFRASIDHICCILLNLINIE